MDGYIKQVSTGWIWIGRSADKFNGSGHYKSGGNLSLVGFDSAVNALADAQKTAPGITIISEAEYYAEAERRLQEHRDMIQTARDGNNGRLPFDFVRKYS